ncbi:hypothetical protein V5O48_006898 [Marasmius crinis-equi]|uniref:Gelsolin-like domain-containing protein n=1 Tax=Marasmius crinis-equi TaxID=585013 RepID=A0ABR3FI81_9AGAR
MKSPRQSSDIPKPEDGLSEWTSRIRALQQQVDADEEAEHRRLEEEIAASRMARMRRSRGAGYGGGSRTSSVDFSDKDKERLPKFTEDAGSSIDDMRPIADRQRGQEDAMRKFMGSTSPPSSISSSSATPSYASSRVTSPAISTRPEPVSLAAFMGGRGTGPRLNKHAPQQDAHDPTQFEQRTRITSPHPVFGKGGVAMPGMAKQPSMPSLKSKRSFVSDETPAERGWKEPATGTRSPADLSVRERTSSSPFAPSSRPSSVASRYTETVTQRPLSPQKSGGRDRERTMSSPNKPSSDRTPFSHTGDGRKTPIPAEPTGGRISPQKTGNRERATSTPGRTSPSKVSFVLPAEESENQIPESPKKKRASFGGGSRPKTPTQDTPVKKPTVETPYLARTIQPQARSPPNTPQISMSQNPSAAFLKAPAPKEPTASLRRLQNRGLVQNFVKASEVFQNQSSTQTTPEKGSGGRKASVLDRWQPQGPAGPTNSPPPPVSPKPMRKSWSTEPPSPQPPSPQPPVSKPVRSFTALPPSKTRDENRRQSIPKETSDAPAQDMKGVGSATTLVVFKSVPTEAETTEFADVDELGLKSRRSSNLGGLGGNLPVHAGKPLIHPTRERAKKPKKTTSSIVKTEDREQRQPRQADSLPERTRPITPKEPERAPAEQTFLAERRLSPQPSQVTPPSSNGTRTGRVTDRWAEQPIIGVKPVLSRGSAQTESPKPSAGMVGRKALPGLATTPSYPSTFNAVSRTPSRSPEVPTQSPAPSSPVPREGNRSVTPARHSRIPSTGNRATVMDIANAFDQENDIQATASPVEIESPVEPVKMEPAPEVIPESEDESQRLPTPATSQLERRRSTFEKYSVPPLPPLKEVPTPISSPAGTLARPAEARKQAQELFNNKVPQQTPEQPRTTPESVVKPSKPAETPGSRIIHLSHVDHPLPPVDYNALMKTRRNTQRKNSDATSISVDVMHIQGNTSTPLSQDVNIFYDTEVLALVHRYKSKSSGLVATAVWGWFGKNSQPGERERNKLEELAKRYGTSIIPVNQYHEPSDLIQVLGNQLYIRQGSRAHWSAENTAMHKVRSKKGYIFVDELDINIKNLCSGFSYCVSLLDTVYVWHGCGSTDAERSAALQYGRKLSSNIVELSQGVNDQEEMFWMVFGDDPFACADYWRWKRESTDTETHIWRIDTSDSKAPVTAVDSLGTDEAQNFVHILDCVWEYFVVVGHAARAKRTDIRLGLAVATEMSSRVRHQRPYTPTVHTLVFPTQIPVDVSAHFRELDESLLNEDNVPDHMNILTKEDALDHLRRRSWEEFALRDRSMLPLGMDAHPLSSSS